MGDTTCIKCGKQFRPKRSDAKQCPDCRRNQQKEAADKANKERSFKKFAEEIKRPDVYTNGVFDPGKARKALEKKRMLDDWEYDFYTDYYIK